MSLALSTGLGFLLGILATSVYEWLRRPWIAFAIGSRSVHPGFDCVFLHLDVLNRRLPHGLLHVFCRPAVDARAYLEYFDREGRRLLDGRLDARWTNGREPFDYVSEKTDLALAIMPQRETLQIGEAGTVPVLLRWSEDAGGYAFTNRSYLQPTPRLHRLPEFRLPEEPVLVRLFVESEGRSWASPLFRLDHTGPATKVSICPDWRGCGRVLGRPPRNARRVHPPCR